ncbi:hypothetical protein JCM1840_005154 [Sporobolomyces johnsonii]
MSPSATYKPETVVLWCHPRSTSTAWECVLLGLKDQFRVLHENSGEAWYYSKERVSQRFSEDECKKSGNWDRDYKKSWEDFITPKDGLRTFNKDMAQYLFNLSLPSGSTAPSFGSTPSTSNNPTLIPTSLLFPSTTSISHTFLIRSPAKAVPSYARLCFPGSETGFEYFDPNEMGYRELRLLFDFVKEETGQIPLVVESEELLKDPEAVMGMWCDEVGIEFHKDMLEWDVETREHFDKWPGFHVTAAGSKGIGKHGNSDDTSSGNSSPQPDGSSSSAISSGAPKPALTPELQKTVEDCMADYLYLQSFARKP